MKGLKLVLHFFAVVATAGHHGAFHIDWLSGHWFKIIISSLKKSSDQIGGHKNLISKVKK